MLAWLLFTERKNSNNSDMSVNQPADGGVGTVRLKVYLYFVITVNLQ